MADTGDITVEELRGAWVVALHGEHDISTTPRLEAELDALLATGARVVIDLSATTFLDSSVVHALFRASATPGRVIAVAAPLGALPRRLIDLVALSATVPTFDSRDAAVTYATNPGA